MKQFNVWKLLVILLLVIGSTLWILVNSLMDFEASHNSSEVLVDAVVPEEYQNLDSVGLIVRKTAHIIEYSLLGITVMILTLYVKRYYITIFGFACFYTLAIAVLDEYLQSFSDRNSSTGDIILDFVGVLLGFFAGWLIVRICDLFRKHSKKEIDMEMD